MAHGPRSKPLQPASHHAVLYRQASNRPYYRVHFDAIVLLALRLAVRVMGQRLGGRLWPPFRFQIVGARSTEYMHPRVRGRLQETATKLVSRPWRTPQASIEYSHRGSRTQEARSAHRLDFLASTWVPSTLFSISCSNHDCVYTPFTRSATSRILHNPPKEQSTHRLNIEHVRACWQT